MDDVLVRLVLGKFVVWERDQELQTLQYANQVVRLGFRRASSPTFRQTFQMATNTSLPERHSALDRAKCLARLWRVAQAGNFTIV